MSQNEEQKQVQIVPRQQADLIDGQRQTCQEEAITDPVQRDRVVIHARLCSLWLANIFALSGFYLDYWERAHGRVYIMPTFAEVLILGTYGGATSSFVKNVLVYAKTGLSPKRGINWLRNVATSLKGIPKK